MSDNSEATATESVQQGTEVEAEATQATEVQAHEAASDATSETSQTTEAPAESAPAEQPKPDWRDRRIAQLTARLREEQARQSQSQTNNSNESSVPSQAEFDAAVRAEAARVAAAERFNQQCLEVVNQGKSQFQDFDSRVEQLKRVVDPGDQVSAAAYSNLIAAAIETGEGAKIIHQLGGDLNEASRLMALSPVKLGIELARMAAKEPEQTTSAPRPIRNLGSAAQHTSISPSDPSRQKNLSTAEWMKRREAEVAERRQAGRR